MMSVRTKFFTYAGLLAMLAVAAWFMGLSAFIRDAAAPPAAGPLRKLDAIVVLTGGSDRVDTGFDLLQQGAGKKLFISGVYRGLEVKQLLERWKDEPQSNLDCCVILGFAADNTAGNAVETIEWLEKEGYQSFYLVTANYHIKRALLHFNATPGLEIIPFPIVPGGMDMRNWWRDPATRKLVLREYMKYIATYAWLIGKFL